MGERSQAVGGERSSHAPDIVQRTELARVPLAMAQVDSPGVSTPLTSSSPITEAPASPSETPASPAPGSPAPGSPAPSSPAPSSPAPTVQVDDATYFADLSPTELEWYGEHGCSPASLDQKVLTCTACHKQISEWLGPGVMRHPALGVAVCRPCQNFYHEGVWERDEDGTDLFCRWCANGGDLILCDSCTAAFCKRCLRHNLGRRFLSTMSETEEWRCLLCDPRPLYKFRAEYHAYYQRRLAGRGRRKKTGTRGRPPLAARPRAGHFVDQTLEDALRAAQVLTQGLEEERRRWTRSAKRPPGVCPTIKNLRRVFHATKYSMDALDRGLLEHYHEKYPEAEFASVKIGSITAQSNRIPAALKVGPSGKRPRGRPRKIQTPLVTSVVEPSEGEEDPASPADVPDHIDCPGSPSTADVLAKPGEYKVSLSLFSGKKKRKRRSPSPQPASDSEIETLD